MKTISQKPVKLPKTARLTHRFYEMKEHSNNVMLSVSRTRTRIYIQTDETYPDWRISDESEAQLLIASAEEQSEAYQRKSIALYNARNFVEKARELLTRWENKAKANGYFLAIEDAFIRRVTKPLTLDERIRLEVEKNAIEETAYDAMHLGEPLPDLPYDWSILVFYPDRRQLSFKW